MMILQIYNNILYILFNIGRGSKSFFMFTYYIFSFRTYFFSTYVDEKVVSGPVECRQGQLTAEYY
jgi:hypothetical protein